MSRIIAIRLNAEEESFLLETGYTPGGYMKRLLHLAMGEDVIRRALPPKKVVEKVAPKTAFASVERDVVEMEYE